MRKISQIFFLLCFKVYFFFLQFRHIIHYIVLSSVQFFLWRIIYVKKNGIYFISIW